jgi:hypothetical protein
MTGPRGMDSSALKIMYQPSEVNAKAFNDRAVLTTW